MATTGRIDSRILAEAGLTAMRQSGRPLTRVASKGRAMIYAQPNGETVRIRTCNDHVLIVVGDSPAPDTRLNIQGTDWLLIVMPEIERTPGKVLAYLVPALEVESEARRTHQEWLASNPNTNGQNRTWNLWFHGGGPQGSNDYAVKWAKYRLDTSVASSESTDSKSTAEPSSIKAEVELARRRIADVAGVPVNAVKITINFES